MTRSKPLKLSEADHSAVCHVVHEALRAYGASIGQNPIPTWKRAPKWMKKSTKEGVDSVLADPDQKPGTQHQIWIDAKKADGWRHGKVKDGRKKTHPMMVPFEQLPKTEQRKDTLLISIVQSFLD